MSDLISIDEFRREARSGTRPDAGVFRAVVGVPKMVDESRRAFRFCFSDSSTDRMQDTIEAAGWRLSNFAKAPTALFAHDSSAPPIGRAANVLIEDQRLMGDIEFAPPEVYGFADTIYKLVKGGYLNATSVGFLPIEYEWSKDEDREWGIDFKVQELLEISIVPVPANPNALIEARAKGIDTRPLVEWAEKCLDGGGKIVLPRAEVDRLRRVAKEPAVRSRRKSNDWRCGAARDLPIDDSNEWDGPAAEASIWAWAGFDGGSPDSAKARKAFLIYDAGNDKEKGAYKLPFCRVFDGELKAVEEGIRAAASRLPQTDAPESEREIAREVINHYEARMHPDDDKAVLLALVDELIRREGGLSETDPAAGGATVATCGREKSDACGLINPSECAVHGDDDMDAKALQATIRRAVRAEVKRAGVRRDTEDGDGREPSEGGHPDDVVRMVRMAHEHLKAADDFYEAGDEHHEKALDLLESARKAMEPDDDGTGDGDGNDDDGNESEDKAARLRRLKALRDQIAAA